MARPTEVPFQVIPEPGAAEHRTWATDIVRAENGSETRLVMSNDTLPVRAIEGPYRTAARRESMMWEHLLQFPAGSSTSYPFAVPLWLSLSRLTSAPSGTTVSCTTANRQFEDVDLAILVKADGSDAEVVNVVTVGGSSITISDSLLKSFTTGDLIFPAIRATPTERNSLAGAFSHMMAGQASFAETEDRTVLPSLPAPALDTYLQDADSANLEVWDFTPHGSIGVDIVLPRDVQGEAWQSQKRVVTELAEAVLSFTLRQSSEAERQSLRDFFDSRQGRFKPFWVQSYKADLITAVAAVSTATEISVEWSRETEGLTDVTRHIYIPTLDQRAKITDSELTGGVSVLTISPGLTGDLAAGAEIRYLRLCRFDDDTLTITLDSDRLSDDIADPAYASVAQIRLRELQRESAEAA